MKNLFSSFLMLNILDDIDSFEGINENIKLEMYKKIKESSDYDVLYFSIYKNFPSEYSNIKEVQLLYSYQNAILENEKHLLENYGGKFTIKMFNEINNLIYEKSDSINPLLFEQEEFINEADANDKASDNVKKPGFFSRVVNKATRKAGKAYKATKKGAKKVLPKPLAKLIDKGEYETKELWGTLRSMPVFMGASQVADFVVPGIPVGTMTAMAVLASSRAYQKHASGASKVCRNVKKEHYVKYDKCIKAYNLKGRQQQIKELEMSKTLCNRTKSIKKCIENINKEIYSTKMKMLKKNIKVHQKKMKELE